jgi:hypothetical protein
MMNSIGEAKDRFRDEDAERDALAPAHSRIGSGARPLPIRIDRVGDDRRLDPHDQ